MAECLLCEGKDLPMAESPECTNGLHEVGICDRCRRHAQIGAAVERMPAGSLIGPPYPMVHRHEWFVEGAKDGYRKFGPTPLDALKKAGLAE